MPFKSLAQEGYLHEHPEILGSKMAEWDAATKGKHLPKRKSLYRHAYKMRQMEHREMGGPVEAGKPYMVGENGPEPFAPHTDGTIVPNKITGSYNPSPGMSHPAGKIL